jgi:hypothetical protein
MILKKNKIKTANRIKIPNKIAGLNPILIIFNYV